MSSVGEASRVGRSFPNLSETLAVRKNSTTPGGDRGQRAAQPLVTRLSCRGALARGPRDRQPEARAHQPRTLACASSWYLG